MEWVQTLASQYEADTIENRRWLHCHPELGCQERETTGYVAQKLREYGLEVQTGFDALETGVLATLRGEGGGSKVLLLRADMDALEIREDNDLPFRSQNERNMHACGHDAHTAMLLTAARILSENRDQICGTVKLLFQPAEEGPYPGGASYVIKSGAVDDADAAFALHVTPNLPVGQLDLHRGAGTASADMFVIEVIGRGGHGAESAKAIDPIVMSAQVINAFQAIVSRNVDARDASVLSVCTISGGDAGNAIPEKVTMTGTLRHFDEDVRNLVVAQMEAVLKGVAQMHGGRYTFTVNKGYPALINDNRVVALAQSVCERRFGAQNVRVLEKPVMGGEDFAYIARKMPATLLWFGCAGEGGGKPLHNPGFLLEEACLAQGSALLVEFALEYFRQGI